MSKKGEKSDANAEKAGNKSGREYVVLEQRKRPRDFYKNLVGRPTKYKKKYCQDIVAWFDVEVPKPERFKDKMGKIDHTAPPFAPPTLYGYCAEIGISIQTIFNWCKDHPEFLDAYNAAKTLSNKILMEASLQGSFNPQFAKLAAVNMMGWSEKIDQTLNAKVQIVIDGEDADL